MMIDEQIGIRNMEIKRLYEENTKLKCQLEQKDDIIKEVREYINECIKGNYFKRYDEIYRLCDELLEILGSDKE
ncbi:MAG: hypothetical protein IKE91_06190 [Clostridia bacterium]|nr:hypothetical protein [Clostridia bacterium]